MMPQDSIKSTEIALWRRARLTLSGLWEKTHESKIMLARWYKSNP
jgi:hypothetical protein